MNSETLATELIKEAKVNAKRWFIIAMVILGMWLATIGGFIVYLSLPEEEVTVENDSGNANYIGSDLNGVINNGEGASSPTEQATEKNS